jgi:hypothetical protein
MADDLTPHTPAPFGRTYPPPRSPRWGIVVALLIVAVLGAWFAWQWPTTEEIADATDPQAHGRAPAVGTSGDRVPGATGAPAASSQIDKKAFPMPATRDRTAVIAYNDKQPLYLAASAPETIPDDSMMIEATTEEGRVNGGYHLYLPKDAATGGKLSARYYYLRTGPNQYVRVTTQRPAQ